MRLITSLLMLFLASGCNEKSPAEAAKEDNGAEWTLSGFTKADSLNPILTPDETQSFYCPLRKDTVAWEERNVLNPSAVVRDGKVYLIYRAQDAQMTSRLGLAVSTDGLHFQKAPSPVMFPDNDSMKKLEWPGGVEDPRVVESEDGTYILTYTSYDGKVARLCLATSRDLLQWKKHGPVLADPEYRDTWSKSGAIVSKLVGEKVLAVKVGGKYWMYFGDTDLFVATSTDLLHWKVEVNAESKKPITVLHSRPGYFDSRLVEPGPYALLRDEGILLIYNGSNAANFSDSSLPRFTYSAGQALFQKDQPFKLIRRTDTNFLRPDKEYEKVGEVNEVCFVEGLVYFKGRWLLYYGTADSKIAVAVRDER